jgi:hypothetical protein
MFPFCPNRDVTPAIFRILRRFREKSIIYGPRGISKTTSIIFYCYLSRMISDYDMQYPLVD